jgi:hypothetical protein
VQPPYFALEQLTRSGPDLCAEVAPDPSSPRELGAIGSAELARHLAILGSCAVSFALGEPGRTYYPVHRARLVHRGPGADRAAAPRLRLTARCTRLDRKGSIATAVTELLAMDGALVVRFEIDYHVIPEAPFRSLFAAHAEPTGEDAKPESPYAAHRPVLAGRFDGERITAELGVVEPAMCLGHFRGYPAFPVSIMARHAFDLVAEGIRQRAGWSDVRGAVVSGHAETWRFLWAHERVHLEARPTGEAPEMWVCDIVGEQGLAARFVMEMAARPA